MSRKGRSKSKGKTPPRTQGARRATGGSGGALAAGQRWSAGRKREVVLRMLRGDSLDALSRELGVEIYRLEEWRDKALSGMDLGLKDRQDDPFSEQRRRCSAPGRELASREFGRRPQPNPNRRNRS